EEEPTDMFMTSAPSRLPASSKDAWVRVETSKNKLMSVRPRSETCFLSIWRLRSTKCSARSSSPKISSRESPSIPNTSRWLMTKVDFGAMSIKAASIGPTGAGRKGAGAGSVKAAVDVSQPATAETAAKSGYQWTLALTGARMERAMRVEEVLNQSPPYVDVDLYASDRPLQSAVAANGGERDAAALSAFGQHWGTAE